MSKGMKAVLLAGAMACLTNVALAQDLPSLNPDEEPDRMAWSDLESTFGPIPAPPEGTSVGGVSKTLTNEYWRSLGDGYQNLADEYGVRFAYQAAPNEGDQLGQLSIAENMILQGYDALLFSPQTDNNLQPALESATRQGIPVVNVNDAVIPAVAHYVGNVQRDNGVRVAQWFIDHDPDGGEVAIIEGPAGVFAPTQRTAGFTQTINDAGNFDIVASVPADWSREKAYDQALTILQQYPDLIGFYVNNDTMALGVVEAVKAQHKLGEVAVFGTDGISDAYDSIRAGELTGTVDSFAELTGEVGMEVALRLIGGQDIPRVVTTPQALITHDNIDLYQNKDPQALRETLLAQ